MTQHTDLPDAGRIDHFDIDTRLPAPNEKAALLGTPTTPSPSDDNRYLTASVLTTLNEPTGFPNRTDSALSFNPATRRFTINPTAASFDVWQAGVRTTISSSDVVNVNYVTIPDTSGFHIIYYDAGVLSQSPNPDEAAFNTLVLDKVLVGLVYWNATDDAAYILGDERHGVIMDGRTHMWIHNAVGAVYSRGLGMSGYVEDDDADASLTFEVADGEIYDQDVEHSIEDGNPANQYEQQLNGADAEITILYRDDVDGSWTEDAATTLPYKSLGAGRLAYNNDDLDGTFSQVEVTDNKFLSITLVATSDWQYPIKMIQGQNEYTHRQTAIQEATAEILAFGTLPTPEIVFLYRLVMQTKNTFGGSKKAKIVDITDLRGSQVSGASAVASDHGALGGLADDDHPQYVLEQLIWIGW